MRIETILNYLEPYKGFVYQESELNRNADTIEVTIREREGSRVSCPLCGKRCTVYDHRSVRHYYSIPYGSQKQVHNAHLPDMFQKSPLTLRR
jgi:hypothetical protein